MEVTLGEDGEVLIRGPVNTSGYYQAEEQTRELIDEDGWVHTGDIGTMDDDGFVSIVDRKKELIITSRARTSPRPTSRTTSRSRRSSATPWPSATRSRTSSR